MQTCCRIIAARTRNLHRLVVDDPVSDARLDAGEILLGELILLFRIIVVDRIDAVNENSFCRGSPLRTLYLQDVAAAKYEPAFTGRPGVDVVGGLDADPKTALTWVQWTVG